jgi:hypothetical protein
MLLSIINRSDAPASRSTMRAPDTLQNHVRTPITKLVALTSSPSARA